MVETKNETRSDTVSIISDTKENIFKGIIIERTRPVYSQTIIEQPCDSAGNLRPINTIIGSGKSRSSIISREGKLFIEQFIDSTTQVREQELISRYKRDSINSRKELTKEFSKTSVKVIYVYPWWVYVAIIGFLLFAALWIWQKINPYF